MHTDYFGKSTVCLLAVAFYTSCSGTALPSLPLLSGLAVALSMLSLPVIEPPELANTSCLACMCPGLPSWPAANAHVKSFASLSTCVWR